MFLWRNVANYPRIIPVTPSYLELCVYTCTSSLQVRVLLNVLAMANTVELQWLEFLWDDEN